MKTRESEISQINSVFTPAPQSESFYVYLPILLKLGKAQQLKDEWRTEAQRVTKQMMYSKLMLQISSSWLWCGRPAGRSGTVSSHKTFRFPFIAFCDARVARGKRCTPDFQQVSSEAAMEVKSDVVCSHTAALESSPTFRCRSGRSHNMPQKKQHEAVKAFFFHCGKNVLKHSFDLTLNTWQRSLWESWNAVPAKWLW